MTVNGANVNEAVTFTSTKKKYTITVSSGSAGSASGGGVFEEGEMCSVSAAATGTATFVGWYEGTKQVSSSYRYSFIVNKDRKLMARFNGR